MSNLLNKIPVSPLTVLGNPSVPNNAIFGTNFSVLSTGGYMEVYSINDLDFIIPSGSTGLIEYSANTIPIQFNKGTGSAFSYDVITLNSDNISSGRRKIGMLVYVIEEKQVYQYRIDNYDTLWNAATGATGPGGATVVVSNFGTTVKNNTEPGQNFIDAWLNSTVTGVSPRWVKYYGTNLAVTGGTYNPSINTLTLTNITGGTIPITGFSDATISAFTYNNNNTLTITDTSGGTFNATIDVMSGLTVNGIISATTINGTNLTISGGTQSLFSGGSSSELVKIIQNGPGDAFVVEDISNGDASHFVINSSGNTAIGLTQPLGNDKLTVSGNTSIYGTLYATTYQNLPVSVINTSSLFSTGLSNTGLNASGVTYSIFLGPNAGQSATNANNSTFLNENAGRDATGANNSIFIGQQAGYQATNAYYSNFLGQSAGQGATSANNSNFFGPQAGYLATNASISNLFGYNVGRTFTGNNIGSNNIIIGTNITLPNTRANGINIGGVLFGINTYSNLAGNPFTGASSTGKIGINIVTPTEALHVSGNTLINGQLTADTINATTSILPTQDITVNIGTPTNRFREVNTYSGTTTIWSATTTIYSPTLDLGLDSLGNSRILTANSSILNNDVLLGGSY
jgi:hypothetical protein